MRSSEALSQAMPDANEDSSLFVYGSLLDAARRRKLLGRNAPTVAARLIGYERRRRRFFYVIERADAVTAGLVLLDLRVSDLEILDRYEEVPRLYRRERADVIDAGGRSLRCWVYLPTARLAAG